MPEDDDTVEHDAVGSLELRRGEYSCRSSSV